MKINEHNRHNKVIIKSISDYLNIIEKKINKLKKINMNSLFCYRGEDRIHGDNGEVYVHSMPNIFRPTNFNKFNEFKWFEKSILDEVKSNNLSKSIDCLEIAMDAQHGGFPSRLLDITFNSLIALFFAITPHYTMKIKEHDNVDGRVIVYAVDKMTTSKTETIMKIYKELVNEKKYNSRLDAYFHLFIDFVDLNSRIKAQQGGFILFGGNQFVPIPTGKFEEITIPKEFKEELRQQLDLYFGINMGTIYPEPDNKADYIITRASKVENNIDYYSMIKEEIEFNIINKIDYIKFELGGIEGNVTKSLQELAYYMHDVVISLNTLKECSEYKYPEAKIKKIEEMVKDKIKYVNSEFYSELGGDLMDAKVI